MLTQGDWVSLDAAQGEVFAGRIPTIEPDISRDRELATLLGWADETKRLGIRANADTPDEATRARQLGATGIGLCRTEHMFREEGRPPFVQAMILAAPDAKRGVESARAEYLGALDKLGGFQTGDFYGILQAMDGLPVIIRLIDPPLHEFLPRHDRLLVEVTEARVRGESGPSSTRKSRCSRPSSGCTSRTRCSACAAADLESSSPRSSRCRSAPLRPRPPAQEGRQGPDS